MIRLLVTGAAGFIGSELCRAAVARGHQVRGAVRAMPTRAGSYLPIVIGDIGHDTNWTPALRASDVVIHLAARVHVMREPSSNPEAAFDEVNVEGTRRLAAAAALTGVRRLVLVSSLKVNGESSTQPLRAEDPPCPTDAYARSKLAAETAAREVGVQTGMEVVVVRPPLVYGPGVGGNVRRLLHWISRGVPLPFRSVNNRRSLIGVANLADLLLHCAEHPAAPARVVLAADGEDLSTPSLIEGLARGLGRPAHLVSIPIGLLGFAGRLAGKGAELQRLTGSLQVDARALSSALHWAPPVPVETGLRDTGAWFQGIV